MRVPHTISPLTREVYAASSAACQLLDERSIALRAGNLLWVSSVCHKLVTLCVKAIAKNFERVQHVKELTAQDRDYLAEILPVTLPLALVIPLIDHDIYWQRRYTKQYGSFADQHPDSTWKCTYLERYLQQFCEEAESQYGDEYELDELFKLCAPYIHTLKVRQMRVWKPPKTSLPDEIPEIHPISHLDFYPIIFRLNHLVYLEIQYGMRDVGLDYAPRMFEVAVDDLQKVAKAVNSLYELRCLKIHRSNIKDVHIKGFTKVMLANEVLKELDFSYCKIGDSGAKCLAKLLTALKQLRVLNLRGNEIGEEGANGLAFALSGPGNCFIYRLDLSLNPLGNEGIMKICSALLRCNVPEELNIRGCGINGHTAIVVASMLQYNDSLKELDIACNELGEEAGQVLLTSLEGNHTIMKLDLRQTGIPEDIKTSIKVLLKRNIELFLRVRERKRRMFANSADKVSMNSIASLSMYNEFGSTQWYSSCTFDYDTMY